MERIKLIKSSNNNHRKQNSQIENSKQQPRRRTYILEKSNSNYRSMASPSHLINTTNTLTTSISLAVSDRQHNDETNAEKIFENIILFCQQENTHFVDDQFPPIERSIGDIDGLRDRPLEWLRISEISPLLRSDLHLKWSVHRSPEPSDIQQGTLGDCWLMAALALITERPQMLNHILLTKTINKQGVYLVRICHNGLWKTVIVDDCFPCTRHKQLAFTQAHRRQLYVPLIEKACAKLFGSYADLISGQTEEGLQLLTGAPCDHIDIDPSKIATDSEIIWAKLLSACESNLLIGATTGRSDINPNEYVHNNISNNHAFSVLAAHSIPHVPPMQFVLVRDPHARSNYHESMTPQIRNQLNSIYRNSKSSGAFWISWEKFLFFFNSITISSYSSDYFDIREVNRFTRSSTQLIPTYHFHLERTSLVNISLIYHRENRRIRNFHSQSFVLCNVDQGPSKDVGTREAILCTNRGAFTHWVGSLRPGFYVVIPFSFSFWNDNNSMKDYTLVIHSKVQINVQVTPEPATLLTDCLIATVLNETNLEPYKGKDYNYYVTKGQRQYTIFIAENLSSTDFLNIENDLNDSFRIRNSRKSLSIYDCIPPRHRQIVLISEWANEHQETAKLEYIYRAQHVKNGNSSIPEVNNNRNDFHSFRPF